MNAKHSFKLNLKCWHKHAVVNCCYIYLGRFAWEVIAMHIPAFSLDVGVRWLVVWHTTSLKWSPSDCGCMYTDSSLVWQHTRTSLTDI